jgi:hypothetical protein
VGRKLGLERRPRPGGARGRRLACLAYNTTPERFSAARALLARALERRNRDADGFPNALATMWTWISNDRAEGERVLADVLGPLVGRDPDELRRRVCVGPAEHCAELLSRYAEAGCRRVYLWPLGEEQRQLELVASEVAPMIGGNSGTGSVCVDREGLRRGAEAVEHRGDGRAVVCVARPRGGDLPYGRR